ncbi:MAG: GNAT family N-acetyltransferase [archaeon]
MLIRRAKSEDLKEIDRIYCEGGITEMKLQFNNSREKSIREFKKHKKTREASFRRGLKNPSQYWIVSIDNGRILGFGQASMKKKGRIEKIYVDKGIRNRGIGSGIIKELLSWLKKKKAKDVNAWIFVKNIPSIKLHKKFGLKLVSINMWRKLRC